MVPNDREDIRRDLGLEVPMWESAPGQVHSRRSMKAMVRFSKGGYSVIWDCAGRNVI